jgi:cytochrome b561
VVRIRALNLRKSLFRGTLMKDGYTLSQIALHWLVAVLVVVQYLTGASIERTHIAIHMGLRPDRWDMLEHRVHIYCGMAIGSLMVLRLLVRLISRPVKLRGPDQLKRVARLLHYGFYAAIISQATLGFIASYFWFGIAPLHVIGSWIILAMLALHLAASAWHTLILKDDTVDRMILPRPAESKN